MESQKCIAVLMNRLRQNPQTRVKPKTLQLSKQLELVLEDDTATLKFDHLEISYELADLLELNRGQLEALLEPLHNQELSALGVPPLLVGTSAVDQVSLGRATLRLRSVAWYKTRPFWEALLAAAQPQA